MCTLKERIFQIKEVIIFVWILDFVGGFNHTKRANPRVVQFVNWDANWGVVRGRVFWQRINSTIGGTREAKGEG